MTQGLINIGLRPTYNPNLCGNTPAPSADRLEQCLRTLDPQQPFPHLHSPERDLTFVEAVVIKSLDLDGHSTHPELLDSYILNRLSDNVDSVVGILHRQVHEWGELIKKHWHTAATERQRRRDGPYKAVSILVVPSHYRSRYLVANELDSVHPGYNKVSTIRETRPLYANTQGTWPEQCIQ